MNDTTLHQQNFKVLKYYNFDFDMHFLKEF